MENILGSSIGIRLICVVFIWLRDYDQSKNLFLSNYSNLSKLS